MAARCRDLVRLSKENRDEFAIGSGNTWRMSPPSPRPGAPPAGLCGSCVHQKVVGNTRGSSFSMCELAKTDARFAKYPRIPVERCPGWRQR